jgi:cytochrome c oxidase cbb3-type subunit III
MKLSALMLFLALVSCKQERRPFTSSPMAGTEAVVHQMSSLVPGGTEAEPSPVINYYDSNAWGLSEGKRLYEMYNCVGCHAHGGGGMGPPLMDATWIYGSNPEQIFATIMEGRPNGMPAFRGKIPDDQVWQIAAYVRSLGGLTNSGAESGRDDQMKGHPPEQSLPKQSPVEAVPPKDQP